MTFFAKKNQFLFSPPFLTKGREKAKRDGTTKYSSLFPIYLLAKQEKFSNSLSLSLSLSSLFLSLIPNKGLRFEVGDIYDHYEAQVRARMKSCGG
jgi:hypothetical protein